MQFINGRRHETQHFDMIINFLKICSVDINGRRHETQHFDVIINFLKISSVRCQTNDVVVAQDRFSTNNPYVASLLLLSKPSFLIENMRRETTSLCRIPVIIRIYAINDMFYDKTL